MQLNEHIHTIQGICQKYGIHWLPRRGYMPIAGNDYLWCPQEKTDKWENDLSYDGKRIDQIPVGNIVDVNNSANQRRITWHKGTLKPVDDYVFVGVFVLDEEKTKMAGHYVWKRIDTSYPTK